MSTYGEAQRRWYEKNKESRKAKHTQRRKDMPEYYRAHASLTYAKKHGFKIVEFVDPKDVYDRDKGICQLCREPVDLTASGKSWEGPQLHHIEPVHSLATIQLVHMKCNKREKDERQTGNAR